MAKRERGVHPFVTYLLERYYSYQKFQADEGIPAVTGHAVEDVAALPRKPWERMGGLGTFINLSEQQMDDAYVLELSPGASGRPQRHLFEEVVYVLRGRGATSVWQPGGERVSFEWQEGSLFALPLNANYQHFNGSGDESALLLAVTSAPLMVNLFHSRDFVFGCPYVFTDRFAGAPDEFSREATLLANVPGTLYETNFLADVRKVALTEWAVQGTGVRHTYVALAANTMKIHIADFAVGTYKKAHRHGPGAHILILNGTGYSLMWPPGTTPQRFDWVPGSFISPPGGWYHQHFNTGTEPVLHLAFHRPASIYNKNDRGEIPYADEDPQIRRMFEDELARNGARSHMPAVGSAP